MQLESGNSIRNLESLVDRAINFLYLATIIASISINVFDIFRLIDISESFILYTNIPSIFIILVVFLLKVTNIISLRESFSLVALTILANSMVSIYQSRLLEDLIISLLRESIFIALLLSLTAFIVSKRFTYFITIIYCTFVISIYIFTKDAYIFENLPVLLLLIVSYSIFINYLVSMLNKSLIELQKKNHAIKEQMKEIKTQNEELLQLNEELNVKGELLEEKNERLNKNNIELSVSKEELQKLNDTKNKLFSVIGHDIKNPMHVIMGYSRLLVDRFNKLSTEKLKSYISSIDKNIGNLYYLLENLLTWSNSQQNNISYEPENLDIKRLISDTVELFEDVIKRKELKIVFSSNNDLFAFADKNMVHVVIRNLLDNAIKYSNSKGIIRISGNHAKENVVIHITDNGIGIPDNIIENIFELHEGGPKPGTRGEKGTGFGLAISKEFIVKNNGRIWCESVEGEETTFSFSLPGMG